MCVLPVYDGCQAKTQHCFDIQSGKVGGHSGWRGVVCGEDLKGQTRFIKFTSFPSLPVLCLCAPISTLPDSPSVSVFHLLLLESLQQRWHLHILCTPPPVAVLPLFLWCVLLQGLSTGQQLSMVGLPVGAESTSPPLPSPSIMGWGLARK